MTDKLPRGKWKEGLERSLEVKELQAMGHPIVLIPVKKERSVMTSSIASETSSTLS
jgi:hypothetical protein